MSKRNTNPRKNANNKLTENWKNRSNREKFFTEYDNSYPQRDVSKTRGDFRDIPICPTFDEIQDKECPVVESNIIKGKYDSVDHYLDIQYRLLREDFVRPLRRGLDNIKIDEIKDIKVYKNITIEKRIRKSNSYFLATYCDKHSKAIDWENSKRLIYGSLVCLSFDNFHTFCFASVCGDREVNCSESTGFIEIKFRLNFEIESNGYKEVSLDLNESFVILESEAYFEAYRHVLSALKTFNSKNFPLKQYIIDVNTDVSSPSYITSQTVYDLSHMIVSPKTDNHFESSGINFPKNLFKNGLQECSYRRVRLLESSQWPNAGAMSFDESQYESFKSALMRQLVLIQGPPGTGKTYLGLKIVRTLYANRFIHPYCKPILIVCFTNHALDQFLEGMLPFCANLVRIGGRSQSEKLEKFTLKSVRDPKQIARKDIIGMTTTGAARLRHILEAIGPTIVVIEEAAEVLESHVISSLTKHTFDSNRRSQAIATKHL